MIIILYNYHRPIFDHATYYATLTESSSPGTRVVQVNAVDADIGDNGRVVYQLRQTFSSPASVYRHPEASAAEAVEVVVDDTTRGGGVRRHRNRQPGVASTGGDVDGGVGVGDDDEMTVPFAVDDRTGVVTVVGPLDYEARPAGYRLLVTARDCAAGGGGGPSKSADTVVVVRLQVRNTSSADE